MPIFVFLYKLRVFLVFVLGDRAVAAIQTDGRTDWQTDKLDRWAIPVNAVYSGVRTIATELLRHGDYVGLFPDLTCSYFAC